MKRLAVYIALYFGICMSAMPAETTGYLEKAGISPLSASDPSFSTLKQAVQETESRTSLHALKIEGTTLPKVVVANDVKIVEFNDASHPEETTLFFYGDGGKTIFMRLRALVNDPEVRLWSEGPSEIIMSNNGIKWQCESSLDTFRFGHAIGSSTEKSVASDSLSCLATLLGVDSINWSSTFSIISNLVCNGTDIADNAGKIFSEAQTLLHCFSMASVGIANITSTFGCVSGLAKIVGCQWLTCSAAGGGGGGGGTGTNTLTSGQSVSGSVSQDAWKYYQILSGSGATSVTVNLTNLNSDLDLYVKLGSQPNLSSYDCRPYLSGPQSETCQIALNSSTTVYIGVHGYTSGNYTLTATLNSGGSGGGGGGGSNCSHSECISGNALTNGCSSCAANVCSSDSYCCSNSWDSVCVGEAKAWCGGTCP